MNVTTGYSEKQSYLDEQAVSGYSPPEAVFLSPTAAARAAAAEDPKHPTITMYCANNGHPFVAKLRCTDRACIPCRRKDYNRLLKGYSECIQHKIDRRQGLRFMTLTVRNISTDKTDDIKTAVRTMLKDFRRLRSKKYYKKLILAGIRGVELKYSLYTGWNIHLHVLYQGHYVKVCCKGMKSVNTAQEIQSFEKNRCAVCKQKVCLRRDWKHLSNGSPVVDVRPVWQLRKGLEYLLKYIMKPPELCGKNTVYNDVLHKTRIVQTFGEWYRVKIKKHVFKCPVCGCVDWFTDWELDVWQRRAVEFNP